MTGHQKVVASTASEIKKRAGENLLPKIWSSQAADSNIEHNDLDVSAPFSPPYAYQANACTKQNQVDYHQNCIAPWGGRVRIRSKQLKKVIDGGCHREKTRGPPDINYHLSRRMEFSKHVCYNLHSQYMLFKKINVPSTNELLQPEQNE